MRLSLLSKNIPNGKHLDEARDILGEVNTAILLSRHPSPEKIEYIVKPGDVLAKIARKLKTTPEMIMRMNNMSGTMLRIGDKLLDLTSRFLDGDPAQSEPDCAVEPRHVFQAISRARGKAAAETAS